MVKVINSAQEFQQTIAQSTLTVVDFHAVWCGPCKMIAPFVDALSDKYKASTFCKVDVDQLKDVAAACGVSAMPTFQLFRSGNKVGEMRGANPQQLEMLVRQHAEKDVAAQSAKAPYIPAGFTDVTDTIDQSQLDCLNQKASSTIKGLIKGEGELESDADEQLMINVTFNQVVKLHSIKFDAKDFDKAPKTIKLFVNRVGMSFDSVDSVEPTQVIELGAADFIPESATGLMFVRFQKVNTLSVRSLVRPYTLIWSDPSS
ncbi:PITH domain-containing protein [Blastocladiella britannica]|nr:PITH domain-containing protein [Blastocladiella britannica]